MSEKTVFSETFKELLSYLVLDPETLVGHFEEPVKSETIRLWTVRNAPSARTFAHLKSALNAFYGDRESKYLDSITSEKNCEKFYNSLVPVWGQFDDAVLPAYASYKSFTDNINDLLNVAFKLSKGKGRRECVRPLSQSKRGDRKKLVAFNVDGTIVKGFRYSWSVLWEAIGGTPKDAIRLKEDFETGKISYIDWIKDDVKALTAGGLTRDKVKAAVEKRGCHLAKNLGEAVKLLKANNFVVAIISGGADCVLNALLTDPSGLFDEVFINRFVFDKYGNLADIIPTEYDWDIHAQGVCGKEAALKMLAAKYNVDMSDVAFVGNDFNDIGALNAASMKIMNYGNDRYDSSRGVNKRPEVRHLPADTIFMIGEDLLTVAERIVKWQIDDGENDL